MKKFLAFALLAATVSLSACGTAPSNSSANADASATSEVSASDTEISKDPKLTKNGLFDYKINIEGTEIQLPISSDKLKALGYTFCDDFNETKQEYKRKYGKISPHTYSEESLKLTNKKNNTNIFIKCTVNTSDKEINLVDDYGSADYVIYGMHFSTGSANPHSSAEIAQNIKIGSDYIKDGVERTDRSTDGDLKKAFGKADDDSSLAVYYYEQPNKDKDSRKLYGSVSFGLDGGKEGEQPIDSITMYADVSQWEKTK